MAVTLKTIAEKAQVSTMAVSSVLNNSNITRVSAEKRERIKRIADELGYSPNRMARVLAGKASDLIGVVMDSCAPMIYHDRLSRMEKYAAAKGYRFLIGQSHDDAEKVKTFAQEFISYGVAGIICMAHDYPGKSQEIAQCYPLDKTVFLEKPQGIDNCCYISCNIEKAFTEVVGYLAGQGRKRIGLLLVDHPSAEAAMNIRRRGYMQGLQKSRILFDPTLIRKVELRQEVDVATFRPIVWQMVMEQKVDAIVAANDHLAAAALKCLNEMKVPVPKQIAVTGYDNIDLAPLVTPALTTFDDNRDLVAKSLVELLIKLLNSPELNEREKSIIVDPFFMKRESA